MPKPATPTFAHGSRGRLTRHDLERFAGTTLFDRIGRAVCEAGCLPRKELYEAWEVARRVRRLFRGGRIIDIAGGHGLLGQIMWLLDNSSPAVHVVDPALPPSSVKVHEALVGVWPRLEGRVTFLQAPADDVVVGRDDVLVSSHACGPLTDQVIALALRGGARVAVLPCCHDLATSDAGDLRGWIDGPLAVDVMRARRLAAGGYRIWTQTIPASITPKNRLLLGMRVERETGSPR